MLEPGGLYIGWSLHGPEAVLKHVAKLDWAFATARIPNPAFVKEPNATRSVTHTFFVCKKRSDLAVPVGPSELPALVSQHLTCTCSRLCLTPAHDSARPLAIWLAPFASV